MHAYLHARTISHTSSFMNSFILKVNEIVAKNAKLDMGCFMAILNACFAARDRVSALWLLGVLEKGQYIGSTMEFAHIAKVLVELKAASEAMLLLKLVDKYNVVPNVQFYTSLLKGNTLRNNYKQYFYYLPTKKFLL